MPRHTDKLANMAASARKARARNIKLAKLFSLIIVVAAAFVGGFAVRGDVDLLDALGLTQLTGTQDAKAKAAQTQQTYNSLAARVGEVEGIVNKDSLDSYDLDTATTKMLDAFAVSTQDPYLRYYDASRFAATSSDASDNGGGIGVLFNEYNGSAYAVDVFEGSPAQMADVQPNDVVVSIDGDRSHAWTASEVTQALKRDQGSQVVITWRRASSLDDTKGTEFTTTLTVTDQTVKNVTTELTNNVGYIQLKQITQNSAQLVRQAIVDLDSRGAQSYVLDLRDNPGGYLTQAVDISSYFIKSGTIVRITTKSSDETTKNATGDVLTDKPLVVLVNGNTSSSAEVIAASLKDNERATIVGTTTLGKGSVQVTHELTFGGALRYTAAYYKSPLDHDIDGLGINPDISIGLSGDDDNQKSFAMETAQSMVRE
ncbi:S41 family peptidase [uncultured Senegalimassilia sp.]|uniref:S41 family peptidase n=1 Tax=uncultured Senegalimassilia sp. TaxID=1714350 RepID=UPI0025CF8816|nr:S41 family peptidase [uncultured Senegalimassilia sp.]